MAVGHRDDEPDEKFNMAVMGLRLSARSNGVAALHGAVSRDMFAGLWPDVPVDEVPIGSITNGVHAHTWVGDHIAALLAKGVDAYACWDPVPVIGMKDVPGAIEVIRGGDVISYLGFKIALRPWVEKNAATIETFGPKPIFSTM